MKKHVTDKPNKIRADWGALRTEYINGTMSLRELAEANGIKAAGLMNRAAKEGWDAERKRFQAESSKRALEIAADERADRLAKFNAQDLKIAEGMKAKAVVMLKAAEDERTLATLARVFESAQRIGRLALGAATENTEAKVTTRELPASVDEFV